MAVFVGIIISGCETTLKRKVFNYMDKVVVERPDYDFAVVARVIVATHCVWVLLKMARSLAFQSLLSGWAASAMT
jgi:hypothetical protein